MSWRRSAEWIPSQPTATSALRFHIIEVDDDARAVLIDLRQRCASRMASLPNALTVSSITLRVGAMDPKAAASRGTARPRGSCRELAMAAVEGELGVSWRKRQRLLAGRVAQLAHGMRQQIDAGRVAARRRGLNTRAEMPA